LPKTEGKVHEPIFGVGTKEQFQFTLRRGKTVTKEQVPRNEEQTPRVRKDSQEKRISHRSENLGKEHAIQERHRKIEGKANPHKRIRPTGRKRRKFVFHDDRGRMALGGVRLVGAVLEKEGPLLPLLQAEQAAARLGPTRLLHFPEGRGKDYGRKSCVGGDLRAGSLRGGGKKKNALPKGERVRRESISEKGLLRKKLEKGTTLAGQNKGCPPGDAQSLCTKNGRKMQPKKKERPRKQKMPDVKSRVFGVWDASPECLDL